MSAYYELARLKADRLAGLRAAWQHGDRVQILPEPHPRGGFRRGPGWPTPPPLYGTVVGWPVTVETCTLVAVTLDTHQAVHVPPERLRNLTRKPTTP